MNGKKEGFYGWVALGTGALSLFMSGGSGYTFSAFLPVLNGEFGWPVGEISIALSLAMGLMTLSAPAAGFFVGRFGARAAIVLGNLLIAAAFFMLAFHTKQWQLHTGYAILGIGAGIGSVIPTGTIASSWFIRKTALAMSVNVAAMGVGGLILAPLSVGLIHMAGWRQTYLVLAGLTLLLGAILPGLFVRNRPEDLGQVPDGPVAALGAREPWHSSGIQGESANFTLKQATRTSAFWFLCLYGSIPIFIMMFLMAHQINFLTRGIGLSNETAGLAMGLVSGTSVLGTLGMGMLSLKIDMKRLTLLATGLVILSMVLGAVTRSAPLAFTYSILCGIGMGATMVTLMSLIPAYFGRAHFSKILGVSMLFGLLSTLGAPIGGYIYDVTKSYNLAFLVGIGVGFIGLILMLLVRKPLHPSMKISHEVYGK
jgi:MFS family permease